MSHSPDHPGLNGHPGLLLCAAVTVAHTMLVIAYHLPTKGDVYQDLSANYFDEQDKEATVNRAVARIRRLGYEVTLTPNVAA